MRKLNICTWKSCKAIKNNLGLSVAFALSAIWSFGALIILLINFRYAEGEKTLTLNEVGDYLAGAFSPLAFFWLAYGYWMQNIEIKRMSETNKKTADRLLLMDIYQNSPIFKLKDKEIEERIDYILIKFILTVKENIAFNLNIYEEDHKHNSEIKTVFVNDYFNSTTYIKNSYIDEIKEEISEEEKEIESRKEKYRKTNIGPNLGDLERERLYSLKKPRAIKKLKIKFNNKLGIECEQHLIIYISFDINMRPSFDIEVNNDYSSDPIKWQ